MVRRISSLEPPCTQYSLVPAGDSRKRSTPHETSSTGQTKKQKLVDDKPYEAPTAAEIEEVDELIHQFDFVKL